jgi:hypothetical protein
MSFPFIRAGNGERVHVMRQYAAMPWAKIIASHFVDTPDGFLVPPSYANADEAQRRAICNGAGTADFSVPDKPLGVDFTEAANVHDWMTHEAMSRWEKTIADVAFLINLMLAVVAADMHEAKGNPAKAGFMQRVRFIARLKVAMVYFLCVWRHGLARNAGIIPWWRRWFTVTGRMLDWLAWPLAVLRAALRMVGGR